MSLLKRIKQVAKGKLSVQEQEFRDEFFRDMVGKAATQIAGCGETEDVTFDLGFTSGVELEIPYGEKTFTVPPNHAYFVVIGPYPHYCELIKRGRTGRNQEDAQKLASEVERVRRARGDKNSSGTSIY